MERLPRVTAKIFASNAAADDIGQYGSALTGTKVLTSDIEEIQALPAYEVGWKDAVLSNRNYPTLQEMNGLQKTFSQQIAYCLQSGMPEWDSETEYYQFQFCRVNNNFYYSLTDNNIGNNPATDSTNWRLYGGSIPIATPDNLGGVMPDDSTLKVTSDGTLSVNLSNAVVDIPQRIKLEVNSDYSTLTLKAGSVITLFYGTRSPEIIGYQEGDYLPEDSAKNFKIVDWAYANGKTTYYCEIQKDISVSFNAAVTVSSLMRMWGVNINANSIVSFQQQASGTAASQPVSPNLFYYCTDTNYIKRSINNAVDSTNIFSVLCYSKQANNTDTQNMLTRVFNGYGFCGQTFWIDKGLTAKVANGRGADGQCQSIDVHPQQPLFVTLGANSQSYVVLDGTGAINATSSLTYQQAIPNATQVSTAVNAAQWFSSNDNMMYRKFATDGLLHNYPSTVIAIPNCVNGQIIDLDFSANSARILTDNDMWVFNQKFDNYVQKSGDTMTGNLTIEKATPLLTIHDTKTTTGHSGIVIKTDNIDKTQISTMTNTNNFDCGRILFQDKNNQSMGYIANYITNSQVNYLTLNSQSSIGGVLKSSSLSAGVDKNGNTFATCPTPTENQNSTQIATTAWVRTLLGSIGIKTFTQSGDSTVITLTNGFCIQISVTPITTNQVYTIPFIKEFKAKPRVFKQNESYTTGSLSQEQTTLRQMHVWNVTTSEFQVYLDTRSIALNWMAFGQLPDGSY